MCVLRGEGEDKDVNTIGVCVGGGVGVKRYVRGGVGVKRCGRGCGGEEVCGRECKGEEVYGRGKYVSKCVGVECRWGL